MLYRYWTKAARQGAGKPRYSASWLPISASVLLAIPLALLAASGTDAYEVSVSRLGVRSSPSLHASVVFTLSQGERVKITEGQGSWSCVSSAKGNGWVPSGQLIPVAGKDKPAPVGLEGTLSFAPLGGPLVVSVDTKGQLRVSLEAQILTPLGTLSGSLSTDVPTYLEVKCASETRYYPLQSKPFSVRFLDVQGDVDLSHDGGRAVRIILPCRPVEVSGFHSVAGVASPTTGPSPIARFVPTGDGKVLDRQLELLWTEADNRQDVNWYDAKLYCQNLRMGSYRDWRLPTHSQLASIQTRRSTGDYSIYQQFMITTHFHLWSADLASDAEAEFTLGQRAELDRQREVLRKIGYPSGRSSVALTVLANGTVAFSTLSTPLARFSRALCVHDVGADFSRLAEPRSYETEGEGEIVVTARSPNWSWMDLHFRIDEQAFEYDYEIYRQPVQVARVKVPSGRHELHFNERFGVAPIPFLVRRGQTTTIEFRRQGLSELAVEIRIDSQVVYGGR